MARPERFELPTAWFVARYSIQLSYGRKMALSPFPPPSLAAAQRLLPDSRSRLLCPSLTPLSDGRKIEKPLPFPDNP
jgi:hypothetical protein